MTKKEEESPQHSQNSKKKYGKAFNSYLNGEDAKKKSRKLRKINNEEFDDSPFQRYGLKVIGELGRGSYGVVYQVHENGNESNVFAVKANYGTVLPQYVLIQLSLLYVLRNKDGFPNLRSSFIHKNITYIVLDQISEKSFISTFHQFSIQELLKCLYILKENGIFHRDIKPGNFLYNGDTKKGVLVDYGLAELDMRHLEKLKLELVGLKEEGKKSEATELKNRYNSYKAVEDSLKRVGRYKIGTEIYMPIESLLKLEGQSYSSDIWPVGIIMLQFLTRKYQTFSHMDEMELPEEYQGKRFLIMIILQLSIIFGQSIVDEVMQMGFRLKLPQRLPRLTPKQICSIEGFDDCAQELLRKLLQINPLNRISVEDAIGHPFFDSVRKEHMQSRYWRCFYNKHFRKDDAPFGVAFFKQEKQKNEQTEIKERIKEKYMELVKTEQKTTPK